MELVKFIFSGFFTFIGFIILIVILGERIIQISKVFISKKSKEKFSIMNVSQLLKKLENGETVVTKTNGQLFFRLQEIIDRDYHEFKVDFEINGKKTTLKRVGKFVKKETDGTYNEQ